MRIAVHVKPNSKHQLLTMVSDTVFEARLISSPIDGKANAELISLLAKELHVPKSLISVIKGKNSKHKLVSITGKNLAN